MGSNSKKMFEESRKRLEKSYDALAKLIEQNSAERRAPINGVTGIVVNVKQLQKWCEDCICSVDCPCNSCVYGCIRNIDCQCYSCLDDCSRKKNEGENQVEVMESMVGIDEQKGKSSEGVCLNEKCKEWNECVGIESEERTTKIAPIAPLQIRRMAEMKVIMTTVKAEIAGTFLYVSFDIGINLLITTCSESLCPFGQSILHPCPFDPGPNVLTSTSSILLIGVYCEYKEMHYAVLALLETTPHKIVISWKVIISYYTRDLWCHEVLSVISGYLGISRPTQLSFK